jgi:hypothetical protein
MRDLTTFGQKLAAGRKKVIKTTSIKVVSKQRELVKQKVEAVLEGGRRGKEYLQLLGEQALETVTDKVPEKLREIALKELKERLRKELLKDPSAYFTREDTRKFLNMLEERNHGQFYVRSARITQWIEASSVRVARGH